jgi:FkbM family methyltransferase
MNGERCTSVFVGNNRVLTKANFLDLIYLIEADDRLLGPRFVIDGVIERDTTSFFLNNICPDSHCLDVGANFGYYACIMAKLATAGRTIAIEPDPEVFSLLKDNLSINWLRTADLLNVAISESCGTLTLYRRHTRSANTSISNPSNSHLDTLGEQPTTPFNVATLTIDSLAERLSERVDFIKVDVEGAEPLVFAGARNTIVANPNLQIIMEWSPHQLRDAGFMPANFARQLSALGLHASLLLDNGVPRPISWNDVAALGLCNIHLRCAPS